MSEELQSVEVESTDMLPESDQRSVVPEAPSASARYSPAFRLGRSSRSYCADTAWIWQRARFLCSTPE